MVVQILSQQPIPTVWTLNEQVERLAPDRPGNIFVVGELLTKGFVLLLGKPAPLPVIPDNILTRQ